MFSQRWVCAPLLLKICQTLESMPKLRTKYARSVIRTSIWDGSCRDISSVLLLSPCTHVYLIFHWTLSILEVNRDNQVTSGSQKLPEQAVLVIFIILASILSLFFLRRGRRERRRGHKQHKNEESYPGYNDWTPRNTLAFILRFSYQISNTHTFSSMLFPNTTLRGFCFPAWKTLTRFWRWKCK